MTIQILGSGCAKCNLLEKQAREAVAALGLSIDIEKITDFGRIGDMGVMMTPAIAIDNQVQSAGKVLTKDQVITLIKSANLKQAKP